MTAFPFPLQRVAILETTMARRMPEARPLKRWNSTKLKILFGCIILALAWTVVDEFYLMRKIHSSSSGLVPDDIKAAAMIKGLPVPPACEGKKKFLEMLRNAGLPASNITTALCQDLPTKSQVSQLYGSQAIVRGMETCEEYRRELNGRDPVVRITGLFNTGTNALAQALYHHLPRAKQIRQKPAIDSYYQVPWNKHYPIQAYRDWQNQTTALLKKETPALTLVLIRDPFRWMAAMCKANYKVAWMRAPNHCPNLVVTTSERKRPRYKNVTNFNLTVSYGEDTYVDHHESLAHLWSSWNRAYVDEPGMHRLVLRMEDLLFRPDELMQMIANCTGQLDVVKTPFSHQLGRSKEHGQSNDLIAALSKYGTAAGRDKGLRPKDIQYAWKALEPGLMRQFHYPRVRL